MRLHARVLLTLAYSAIFDFPLTQEEIERRLVTIDLTSDFTSPQKKRVSSNEINQVVADLQKKKVVVARGNKITLATHQQDFLIQEERADISHKKWDEVKRAVKILSQTPGIVGIAITGSVAVTNAAQDSDIDFMIVTQPHMLWLCRIWVIWQSWRVGKRRSFAHEEKNSWCFNLWLTTESLALLPSQQSLYTAYEVCQAVWVWQKGRVEESFLQANTWVTNYCENYFQARMSEVRKKKIAEVFLQKNPLLIVLNLFLFKVQYLYMLPHMTREIVDKDKAFFHPRPTRNVLMLKWREELERIAQLIQ